MRLLAALRSFDVTAQLGKIKARVLYVLSRTDKLFPPQFAPEVMDRLKAADVDADYFLLDSDYGHSASGRTRTNGRRGCASSWRA
jgi:homoserine O-acetyltransferase